MFVPLSIPHLDGKEWEYIKHCLDTGWVSSVGSFVTQFEEAIAAYTGASHAIATTSGTAALQLALQVAGVGKGDHVLVPNMTFIASVNAITYLGAIPVLVDVDPDTWQIDLDLVEHYLATTDIPPKAILPVHVLGNIGDMNKLLGLAERYGCIVVEDAAEGLGATFEGRHAGTMGKLGVLSFNGNKIITTGGGGMILTNDSELAERARHLTTQAKSHPIEYIHDEVGYNFRLSNVLAAMGVAQLEQLPGFLEKKARFAAFYKKLLPDLRFQQVLPSVVPNHWLTTTYVSDRHELQSFLSDHQIESRGLWCPMNQLAMYESMTYLSDINVSDDLYQHCLSLPSSSGMTEAQLDHVRTTLTRFYS
ncbi:UNVERIFIED_CONTAM: hypothetical protein GTU68_040890 [Idotea baltica]|nr:hypothetical protein [Idotea baltica]